LFEIKLFAILYVNSVNISALYLSLEHLLEEEEEEINPSINLFSFTVFHIK